MSMGITTNRSHANYKGRGGISCGDYFAAVNFAAKNFAGVAKKAWDTLQISSPRAHISVRVGGDFLAHSLPLVFCGPSCERKSTRWPLPAPARSLRTWPTCARGGGGTGISQNQSVGVQLLMQYEDALVKEMGESTGRSH